MGWRSSIVLIDQEPSVPLDKAVGRLVGEPVTSSGAATVEDVLYPFQLAAGTWRGRTLIFGDLAWWILRGDRGPEHRLLEMFPNARILVTFLQSTVDYYGYAYYEAGQRLRLRKGDCDGSYADAGDLLPAERAFHEGKLERDGETIFVRELMGERYEATHYHIGEDVVFALTGAILGKPLNMNDELMFEHELTTFEPQGAPAHALTLEVEAEPTLVSPTLDDALTALTWLTPSTPSFVILERAEHDYVQAGGSPDCMTVEWREHSDDAFQHFVAGRKHGDHNARAWVPMSNEGVTVRQNEVLDLAAARTLFTRFHQGEPRPTQFDWRDTTHTFDPP